LRYPAMLTTNRDGQTDEAMMVEIAELDDRALSLASKIDDDNYSVHFSGRFWGLFRFEYDMVLTVAERRADALVLSGSKNLGLLFGTFSYTATVTNSEFNAWYCSRHDNGVFKMMHCECQ